MTIKSDCHTNHNNDNNSVVAMNQPTPLKGDRCGKETENSSEADSTEGTHSTVSSRPSISFLLSSPSSTFSASSSIGGAAVHRLVELEASNKELEKANKELNEQAFNLRIQSLKKTMELRSVKDTLQKVQRGLTTIETERRALQTAKETAEQELSDLKASLARLCPKLDFLDGNNNHDDSHISTNLLAAASMLEDQLLRTRAELRVVRHERDGLVQQIASLRKEQQHLTGTVQACFRNMERIVTMNRTMDQERTKDKLQCRQTVLDQKVLHLSDIRAMATEMRRLEEVSEFMLEFLEGHLKGKNVFTGQDEWRALAMKLFYLEHQKEIRARKLEHANEIRRVRSENDEKLSDLFTELQQREKQVLDLQQAVADSMHNSMILATEMERLRPLHHNSSHCDESDDQYVDEMSDHSRLRQVESSFTTATTVISDECAESLLDETQRDEFETILRHDHAMTAEEQILYLKQTVLGLQDGLVKARMKQLLLERGFNHERRITDQQSIMIGSMQTKLHSLNEKEHMDLLRADAVMLEEIQSRVDNLGDATSNDKDECECKDDDNKRNKNDNCQRCCPPRSTYMARLNDELEYMVGSYSKKLSGSAQRSGSVPSGIIRPLEHQAGTTTVLSLPSLPFPSSSPESGLSPEQQQQQTTRKDGKHMDRDNVEADVLSPRQHWQQSDKSRYYYDDDLDDDFCDDLDDEDEAFQKTRQNLLDMARTGRVLLNEVIETNTAGKAKKNKKRNGRSPTYPFQ